MVKSGYAVISLISILCIRKFFLYCNDPHFKCELRNLGFHPSVINNPFILFQSSGKSQYVRYNRVLGAICLRVFVFSYQMKCWNNKLHLSRLFSRIGLKSAYCENIDLLINSKTFSAYDEIKVSDKKSEKKDVVVYSVMIGDYDVVFDPVYVSDNCEYILFTDQIDLRLDVWKIVYVDKSNFHNKTNKWISTYYKILAHKILDRKYKYSIYVDTKVFVCGDIKKLLNGLTHDCNLAMINHTFTSTVNKEMQNCVDFGYSDETQTKIQYGKYMNEGFPDNIGMIDSCILIRAHNSIDVVNTMQIWFEEFNHFSSRDQFSIMYAIWKSGINCKLLNGGVWSNQFSIVKRHK